MPTLRQLAFGLVALSSFAVAAPRVRAPLFDKRAFADFFSGGTSNFANNFPIIAEDAEYDYIVVGGGTAGLAVAYRLAESGENSVAVVEAGGFYEIENGNTSVVPGQSEVLFGDTTASRSLYPLIDWGFITSPQPEMAGREIHYARGKTLGGSSALNGMIYQRGTKGSFDVWAQAVNDSSWTFENLLPYFTGGVNFTLADAALRPANASVPTPPADTYSTTGGPLPVSYPNYACPFSSWAKLSWEALGFPDVNDFMSGSLLGSQYAPATINPVNAERATSEESYLQHAFASGRTNLKVYTHSLAKKVVFKNVNKTPKATAVKVQASSWGNSKTMTLTAKKEIILSAGAFQSPQLLMVSGVGPKATLDQFNIKVIADRPGVGQNMWDHLDVEMLWEVEVETRGMLGNATFAAEAAKEWNSSPPTGILTTNGVDYIAWEKAPNRTALGVQGQKDLSVFPADWPEIEYEVVSAFRNTSNSKNYGALVVTMVAPTSRGNVTIKSRDMSVAPVISPNWLETEVDQQVTIQGIKHGRAFFETSAISPIVIPGGVAPTDDIVTDEQILEYARQTGFPNWHAACTCKMGTLDDDMAVVDSKGRVIGVDGLRVVDASSMAILPPGHPLSTVYVMAEKISADILAANA